MSRATTHRSSEVDFNGKLLYVAGTGRLVVSAATVEFGWFVAPCDGTIRQASIHVVAVPTHATNVLSFGSEDDTDLLLDDLDIKDRAAGHHDLTALFAVVTVNRGEAYQWEWEGGDTTGEIITSMVIEPR